jgi:hypothetical protein
MAGGLEKWIMTKLRITFVAGFFFLGLAMPVRAQETNVYLVSGPLTKLEALETNTDTVIIKGTALMGSVYLTGGQASVTCKEDIDLGGGHKAYGLAIDILANNQVEDRTIIDEEEIDSLLNAMDYFAKVDWSVTALTSFDAVYTSKAGFRIAVFSSKRTRTIEFRMRSGRMSKGILMAPSQLAQFRELVYQAKVKLDSIKTGK